MTNTPLSIENSSFNLNIARGGGALASSSPSIISKYSIAYIIEIQRASLKQCVINENAADIGSALMALDDYNFDLQNTSFTNNIADYGKAIATKPTYLRLKVYQVDEAFLYLDDIRPEYIRAHRGSVNIK